MFMLKTYAVYRNYFRLAKIIPIDRISLYKLTPYKIYPEGLLSRHYGHFFSLFNDFDFRKLNNKYGPAMQIVESYIFQH